MTKSIKSTKSVRLKSVHHCRYVQYNIIGLIHTSSIGVVMMVVVMLVMHPSCILPASRWWPSCSSRRSPHLVGSPPTRTPSPLGTSYLYGELVGLVGMATWMGLALVRASMRVEVVEALKLE